MEVSGGSMTDEELQAIKERCEAATPGPWQRHKYHHIRSAEGIELNAGHYDLVELSSFNLEANRDFIAHAREDIPKLLAEIERLRISVETWHKETERLRAKFKHVLYANGGDGY